MSNTDTVTKAESLEFHQNGKRGKIEINLIKSLSTSRDLSLAYSPGVGYPCLEIEKNPDLSYEYTNRSNFVAVVTNGTAVLGFGDIGTLASKPVMEGKSALFKRFADIDAIDIEVDEHDPEQFIKIVQAIGHTWGGINLEDIKAPECFEIEKVLENTLDIPVFHDDQHGTAIVMLAGLMNAVEITGRKMKDLKVVVNGAGAAGLSCLQIIIDAGVPRQNITLCDKDGIIYSGRKEGMNQYKEKYAITTNLRTLTEAMVGADVFLGLSAAKAVSKDMIASMAKNPIIFAMANPEPEIMPHEIREVRDDAIISTGRTDYPNQINNLLCFPYIFRAALDTRASSITKEMKIAASMAIANLAKEPIEEESRLAYAHRTLKFGLEYIIPTPFDSRLMVRVSMAVAKAAIASGVARIKIDDWDAYAMQLQSRMDSTAKMTLSTSQALSINNKRLIITDGEDPRAIEVASLWCDSHHGSAILVGRDDVIANVAKINGLHMSDNVKIVNASHRMTELDQYSDTIYHKYQRHGLSKKDCSKMIKTDCDVFGATLLKNGESDILLSGLKRKYNTVMSHIAYALRDPMEATNTLAVSVLQSRHGTIFIADVANFLIEDNLTDGKQYADIATRVATFARRMKIEPRVAFIHATSFSGASKYGQHKSHDDEIKGMLAAIQLLDHRGVDFEYDGELSPYDAMNVILHKSNYPFARLKANANVLIMPNANIAHIAISMLRAISEIKIIGPITLDFDGAIQIVDNDASVAQIFDIVTIASNGLLKR